MQLHYIISTSPYILDPSYFIWANKQHTRHNQAVPTGLKQGLTTARKGTSAI